MRQRIILLIPIVAILLLVLFRQPGGETAPEESEALPASVNTEAVISPTAFVTSINRFDSTVEENPDGGVIITVHGEVGDVVYPFSDVAAGEWYLPAVDYAVSTGLMGAAAQKDGAMLFHPNYGVTRAEFAAILYHFFGGVPTQPAHEYEDVPKDAKYYDAVSWADANELLIGKENGFCPDEFLTCEQVLIVLHRIAGKPAPGGTLENYPYAGRVSDFGYDAVAWAWNAGLISEEECVWYPPQAVSRAQIALLLQRYSALLEK